MNTKLMSRLLAGLALLVLAAACSTPQQTTGLQITDFTPERDAVDVAVDTTVSVTFNEALDEETVANGITVVGGGAIRAGEVEYDSTARTLTFTPDAPLAYSTNYLAAVPTSVRSATGGSLSAPVAWTFRTAAAPEGAIVGVTVTPTAATLQLGGQEVVPLTATVEATGGAPNNVTWASSAETVATVSAVGVVTAVSPGTATITATSTFDESKSGSALITVLAANGVVPALEGSAYEESVTEVDTAMDSLSPNVSGGTLPYSFAVSAGELPAGVSLNANTGVISGMPTAVGVFEGAVTVTDDEGETAVLAFDITVEAATVVPEPSIGGIVLDPSAATLDEGQTLQFEATLTDVVGEPDLGVTWSSSDDDVATVGTDGLVTAVSAGEATITATSDFDADVFASAVVTVQEALVLVYLGNPYVYERGCGPRDATPDCPGDDGEAGNEGAMMPASDIVVTGATTTDLIFDWQRQDVSSSAGWSIATDTGVVTRSDNPAGSNLDAARNGDRSYLVTVQDGVGGRIATFTLVFEEATEN